MDDSHGFNENGADHLSTMAGLYENLNTANY